jgi:tetratricopeptide (TPR) repeat protein
MDELFMQENCRWRSANRLISLLAFTIFLSHAPVLAAETASSEASAHVLQAEIALQGKEYLKATIEYRKAAELSDSVELARKATRLGFSYGFNDEALLAAKRWVKLDKASDEARAFLGQLYFRLDDLRNSRRQFERLIETDTEDPGKRLLSLLGYLVDENEPERADKLMRALAKPYRDSAMAHYAVAVLALQAGDTEYAKTRATRSMELDPDYSRPKLRCRGRSI